MNHSILEGNSNRRQAFEGMAFGRVSKVYPEDRMVEVKTFGVAGALNDLHIAKCQWLSADVHPHGDESTNIPRVNSIGIVAFVGGEPFIIGYFRPLNNEGVASAGEDTEVLNEGDKILKTVGKNRIVMRASGELEIESTKSNRTIYFPTRDLINTLCRNYEFRTDGGTEDWKNVDEKNNTLNWKEYRDNIARTNLLFEEKGKIDGGDLIYRVSVGHGDPDGGVKDVVWEEFISNTGEHTLFIRKMGAAAGHHYNIKPDGTTTLNVNDKAKLSILPTGEISLNVNDKSKIGIMPSGETSLDVGGKTKVTILASGELTIAVGSGSATLNIKPSGATTYTTTGKLDVTAAQKITIKGTMVDIDGGGGALQPVLTFPNTLSDFTGLPLVPFSASVKASI